MESTQERGDASAGRMLPQWRDNMRAMQIHIKNRFRVAMTSRRFLRQRSRRPGLVPVPGSPALRATATGFVVARVFQGNVIFARVAHSIAKQEWQKRVGWMSSLRPSSIVPASVSSRFWSLLGYSAAGGSLVYAEQQPTQAEALAVVPPVGSAYGMAAEEAVSAKRKAKKAKAMYYEDKAIAQATENSLVTQIAQAVVLPAVASACHAFMHGLNVTELFSLWYMDVHPREANLFRVYGADKLQEAIRNRPEGQSLITVCNHVASMDDPLVMAALLPPSLLLHPRSLRWTLCATDRCFTNAAFSAFFRSVKVLPLKRGAGLQQEGIDIALSKLEQGDWVHIFPEGSRSRDGGKTIGTMRRGIGRLVTDVEKTPMVIPFVHTGMQDVMPIGSKFPSVSKKVSVLVGDPIELEDLVKENAEEGLSKAALYDAIAVRVGQRMRVMKEELDQLVVARQLQLAAEDAQRLHTVERAQGLLQYVDWEAQGLVPECDSVLKEKKFITLTSLPNSQQDAQVSLVGRPDQLPEEKHANAADDLSLTSEATMSEAEMDEFFELEDDWDLLSKPSYGSILSRVRGFVDTPTFLGLGFAARGLLSNRREQEGLEPNGWRYWGRFSMKSTKQAE